MEDGGIHPLLPIPKHDPRMILKPREIGRPAAAGPRAVRVTQTLLALSTHTLQQGVCFC